MYNSAVSLSGRPEIHINLSDITSQVEKLTNCYTLANEAANFEDKRNQYTKALNIINAIGRYEDVKPTENHKRLVTLFEAYATKTCYAQGGKAKDHKGNSIDNEEGFRKSACLMELSYLILLDILDLKTLTFESREYSDLEAVIDDLNIQKGELGKYFKTIAETEVNRDVLVAKAEDANIRELLTDILIRLTYSHQNIARLKEADMNDVHVKFQLLTEKLIGKDTPEQKKKLADYLYNRCSFLVSLTGNNDAKSKIASYEPVKALLEEAYDENDPVKLSLLAQIENITGLCLINESSQNLDEAELHFEASFALRENLLNVFQDEEKKFSQRFLIANLRTALIHCLVFHKPLKAGVEQSLYMHKIALEDFLIELDQKGSNHSYRPSYVTAIEKANMFLLVLKSLGIKET